MPARRRNDRPLLEREHRLRRALQREHRLDCLPALRVRDGVSRAIASARLVPAAAASRASSAADSSRRSAARGAGSGRRDSDPAAEERTTEVRRAAAAARDDPARRTVERPRAGGRGRRPLQARAGQRGCPRRGAGTASPVERAAAIRADLGADIDVAQEAERAPRRRHRCRDRGGAPSRPPRGDGGCRPSGTARRARRGGRTRVGRDARELLADVLGGDHRTTPSSASRRRLTPTRRSRSRRSRSRRRPGGRGRGT